MIQEYACCLLLLLFSHPVISDSLWPRGLQHARPPCPSPSPGVCPSSRLLHRWCHPSISSSDALFSFCPQSFPASGTFPMSRLFVSDGRNTGASASTSVLPVNIQDWFPLGLTGWISLQSKGLSRVFSPPQSESINSSLDAQLGLLYGLTLTSLHDYWKTIALTIQTFVCKVMSLLLNMLSRFVTAFLPRSKHF